MIRNRKKRIVTTNENFMSEFSIDDLTILCSTCEEYKDMWSNLIFSLDKYWPNHPELAFVSDSNADHSYSGVRFINSKGNFSNRLLCSLLKIKTIFVFLTLDDYLPFENINVEKICFLIKFLGENKASYIKIYNSKYGKIIDKSEKIRVLPLAEPYEVSFTPGIWRREDLIKCLLLDKTPWESEVLLTKKARENELTCYCCYEKHIFDYVDVVRKGKYLRKAKKYIVKNGLYLSNRKVMPIRESCLRGIRSFISSVLPRKCKRALSKKLGIATFSDIYYED